MPHERWSVRLLPGGPLTGRRDGAGTRPAVATARRLARPAGVLAAAVAAVSYVAAIDPNQEGHYPTCPFLSLTGLQCPGCGSLRTVHALAHGRLDEAVALNVFAVAMFPLLAFFWLRWTRARALDRPTRTKVAHPALIWALFGAVLLFWLVRNLPFGAFLAA